MKKPILILVGLAALISLGFSSRWLPILTEWLVPSRAAGFLGYVEAETVLVAPPSAGRLIARPVTRGGTVAAGDALFTIDTAGTQAEIAAAEAALAAAKAKLRDLSEGKREAEIEVIRAQRREAEASLKNAEQELKRARELTRKGTSPQARLDLALSQVDQLTARVAQLKAQEEVAHLGGRQEEIAGAEAQVRQAEATLAETKVRLENLAPAAPVAARVENTFFEVGEWVPAGQPVVSLLPDNGIKLRFFVDEPDLAKIVIGATVAFTCDGCADAKVATVTYVSPRAEYTPPVIYSESARSKLVFMVEAVPSPPVTGLHAGLPVTVTLGTEGGT